VWNESERLGEKKERECESVEREERGRGKHMKGFKRETLSESE
jgi:hypothetical protein